MKRIFASLAVIGLTLFAGGCLELTESFTVNPDGSGKVLIDTVSPGDSMFQPQNAPKPPPEQIIKKSIEEKIKSKGVDAWSDVSCEIQKDGRVHFRGTAYFSDINKLHVNAGGAGSGGDDGSGMSWAKDGNGYKLTFKTNKKAENAPPPEKLTDAELDERIKQERVQYQQFKPMVAAMTANMKISISFALPGKVTESSILAAKDNMVTMSIEGKQIADAMDKVNADDNLMRQKIKGGKAAEDDIMNEAIFGKKGEPFAKVGADAKPQFDYKAESAKAKAGEAEMWKKLGVTPPVPGAADAPALPGAP